MSPITTPQPFAQPTPVDKVFDIGQIRLSKISIYLLIITILDSKTVPQRSNTLFSWVISKKIHVTSVWSQNFSILCVSGSDLVWQNYFKKSVKKTSEYVGYHDQNHISCDRISSELIGRI